jgi:large subunit ribosomal protein L4
MAEERLWVVEDFELAEIKTKALSGICDSFGWSSALLVDGSNDNLQKSARNLTSVQFLAKEGLNTYDILRYENLVLSKSAVEHINGALKK